MLIQKNVSNDVSKDSPIGLILSGYPEYTKKKIGHLLCHHKCCIFSLVSSHGGLVSFPKFMASNSFDVGQVLEVVLRDDSDLEDKESEEEYFEVQESDLDRFHNVGLLEGSVGP